MAGKSTSCYRNVQWKYHTDTVYTGNEATFLVHAACILYCCIAQTITAKRIFCATHYFYDLSYYQPSYADFHPLKLRSLDIRYYKVNNLDLYIIHWPLYAFWQSINLHILNIALVYLCRFHPLSGNNIMNIASTNIYFYARAIGPPKRTVTWMLQMKQHSMPR